MAGRTDNFEIPASWPDRDLGMWVRVTMDEPRVQWIKFYKSGGKLIAAVHYN